MATVKILLRNKPNKEGLKPLVIRITKDRRSSEIHIGYNIKDSDWDEGEKRVKKSHPNSTRLNNIILKKLSEATGSALELETIKDHVSAHAVKQKVKPRVGSTFFLQADDYLKELKTAGKYNQYTPDKSRLDNFREYLGHDIAYQDISVAMLHKFKTYLSGLGTQGERSCVNHLVAIRSVFGYAIKGGVIDAKYSPFGKGKMKIKFPDTVKIGLSREEIERLENVELDERKSQCRDIWLLSYYFAGIRISDVLRLRWTDFQDNRLHYIMGKNDKGDSLKIPQKADKILDKYRPFKTKKDDLIFDELKNVDFSDEFAANRTIGFKTSAIDKVLKTHVAPAAKIEKKLTTHIARHSFAQNATDVDARILQKLFRHTKLETTLGYMGHFRHEATDNALDRVLG